MIYRLLQKVEYLLCVIFESISLIEREGPFTEDMSRNYEKNVSVHLIND